jgi:hypothetical protein
VYWLLLKKFKKENKKKEGIKIESSDLKYFKKIILVGKKEIKSKINL